jgi:hypothetical protein
LNGTVSLTDVQGGSVNAESTSGSVELVNVVSKDIDVSSVSGEVDFVGPLDPQGPIQLPVAFGRRDAHDPAEQQCQVQRGDVQR